LITQHEFDWSVTERPLVVLVPNYGRRRLLEAAMAGFETSLRRDEYLFLVVNDGPHEDFSALAARNVAYFTLVREGGPRNGAKARNYVIKRCRSRVLLQKDPEVAYCGDALGRAMGAVKDGAAWRVGEVALLERGVSAGVVSGGAMPKDAGVGPGRRVDSAASTFLHFGYAAETALLQRIQGYDEAYTHYGYEDVDLFFRLQAMGVKFTCDVGVKAMHLWHEPLPAGATDVRDEARRMREIFLSRDVKQAVRNPGGWGEG
jgi:hypothetical protein